MIESKTMEYLQGPADLERCASQSWYALQVRSRCENAVQTHLRARGYTSFLPLYKSRRRWSDRFKDLELPLFQGYVFSQIDLNNRLPILTIPGVVQIVGVGRIPVPIDKSEFAAIEAALTSGLPSRPWPYLQAGNKVRIESGPLCGLEGILLDFKGSQNLVLSVSLLQRSVAVQVDAAWVRPLPTLPPALKKTASSPADLSTLSAREKLLSNSRAEVV